MIQYNHKQYFIWIFLYICLLGTCHECKNLYTSWPIIDDANQNRPDNNEKLTINQYSKNTYYRLKSQDLKNTKVTSKLKEKTKSEDKIKREEIKTVEICKFNERNENNISPYNSYQRNIIQECPLEYYVTSEPSHDQSQSSFVVKKWTDKSFKVCLLKEHWKDELFNIHRIQTDQNETKVLNYLPESLGEFKKKSEQTKVETYLERHEEIIVKKSGTKSELTNLADSRFGAKLVAANPESKNPSRLIDGKKDTYVMSDCTSEQWFIIQLSRIAMLEAIEIMMKERYSLRIADFAVYGWLPEADEDDMDHMKDLGSFSAEIWEQLGIFIAKDEKGTQRFTLEKRAWIKYLGIKVFTHHNIGTVCIVNEISAFGFTPEQALYSALDDFKEPDIINKTNLTLNYNKDNIIDKTTEINEEEENKKIEENHLENVNSTSSSSISNSGTFSGGDNNNIEKEVVGKEPPTIMTFKKLNRDVKEMQQSNMVLTKYVDELHVGLNMTLDEIEIQLKKLNEKNNILNQTLEKLNWTMLTRVSKLEKENKILKDRLEYIKHYGDINEIMIEIHEYKLQTDNTIEAMKNDIRMLMIGLIILVLLLLITYVYIIKRRIVILSVIAILSIYWLMFHDNGYRPYNLKSWFKCPSFSNNQCKSVWIPR